MHSVGDGGGIRAGGSVSSRDGWRGDERTGRAGEATRRVAQDND